MLIERSMPTQPIRELLGVHATDEQVVEVRDLLVENFPGERLSMIPQATWEWIRTGEGAAPVPAAALSPSATSMMDIFIELPAEKQGQLLALARMMV